MHSSSLKVLLEWTANVHFCTICEITFQIGVVLENEMWSLKSP